MNFVEGNGVLGRIRFTDGAMPEYDRPYLVVSVFDDYIEVLNVSLIKGKEYKLAFKTNERLRRFSKRAYSHERTHGIQWGSAWFYDWVIEQWNYKHVW